MGQAAKCNPSSIEKALYREREARKQAEAVLETKSMELYQAIEILKTQYNNLEIRKDEIETAHSELKQTQSQLIHSEKMASIGQLAAGVAHEINNPVAFIKSNLNTLSGYWDSISRTMTAYEKLCEKVSSEHPQEFSAYIDDINRVRKEEDVNFLMEDASDLISESNEGAHRVQDIVQGLKSFSRLDDNTEKEVDINQGIESTLKVIWNEIKYKCDVEKNLGQIPMLLCHAGQLNQVFMNLIVNASQAMPDKGIIMIDTYQEDNDIVIKIKDTGKGIEAENLKSIFDPFFTTKPVGSGTGLGLAISYGIIREHEGTISVDSEVDKGTCFTIRLPIREMTDE